MRQKISSAVVAELGLSAPGDALPCRALITVRIQPGLVARQAFFDRAKPGALPEDSWEKLQGYGYSLAIEGFGEDCE